MAKLIQGVLFKRCPKCLKELSNLHFHKSSIIQDGLACYCRACTAINSRRDYLARPKTPPKITIKSNPHATCKTCSRCGVVKLITQFHSRGNNKRKSYCQECQKKRKLCKGQPHKRKIGRPPLALVKYDPLFAAWQMSMPTITLKKCCQCQEYKEELKDFRPQNWRCKLCRARNLHKKIKVTPHLNAQYILSRSIRSALQRRKTSKNQSTLKYVGCSKKQFFNHIEKQFKSGMSWENHGKIWHLDHILPCASFDLTQEEDQLKCFHFSNLQPLWATTAIARQNGDLVSIGNVEKKDKVINY